MKQKTIIYGLIGLALLVLAWYYRDTISEKLSSFGEEGEEEEESKAPPEAPPPPEATVDEETGSVSSPGSTETFFDLNSGPGKIALDELTRELALEALPENVDLENVFEGLHDFNAPNEDTAEEFEAVVFEGSSIEDFMKVAFDNKFSDEVEDARRISIAVSSFVPYPFTAASRKVMNDFQAIAQTTVKALWPSTVSGFPAPMIGRFASSTDRRPKRWNDNMIGKALARYVNMSARFLANIQKEAQRLQKSEGAQAIEMLRERGWKFIQTDSPNRTGR